MSAHTEDTRPANGAPDLSEFAESPEAARRLAEEPVSRLLMHYSAPAIVGLIALAAYETVDSIFVGQFVSDEGLSVVMLGFPFFMLLHSCCNILRVGGTSVVSRLLGQGDRAAAARALGNTLAALFVFGFVVAGLACLLTVPILRLCGAPLELTADAAVYARIISAGAPFLFLTFGTSSLLRAVGHPNSALYVILLSCVVNVVLDAFFVGLFGWGVPGAAAATVLSQLCGAVWGLALFFRKDAIMRLRLRDLRIDFALTREISGIGVAYAVLEMNLIVTMIVTLNMLTHYGNSTALAQNLIIESCIAFLYLPLTGVDEGLQPIIGYNQGAGNTARVRETVRYSLLASTIFLIASFLIVQLGADIVVSFFVDDDPAFQAAAARAMRIAFCAAPLVGAMLVIPGILSALGEVRNNLILTIGPQLFIQVPVLLILPRFIGVDGVWVSFPIYDTAAAVLGVWLLWKTLKKYAPA